MKMPLLKDLLEPSAIRNLHRAMKTEDRRHSFDKCTIGAQDCKRQPVDAHAIPKCTLRLIARNSKVYATDSNPPETPISYQEQEPIELRSIDRFSTGKWACREHDEIFGSIDNKQIDLTDKQNLFLMVYRSVLRITQRTLRTVSRVAIPILDPAVKTPAIGEEAKPGLALAVRAMSKVAVHLFFIKATLDTFWKNGDLDQIDYLTIEQQAEPFMAGLGMEWTLGPSRDTTWSGSTASLPTWWIIGPTQK